MCIRDSLRVDLLRGLGAAGGKGDERRLLTVHGVADGAAVEDVALHDPDTVPQVAELVWGAHERGHVVTAGQRALHEQSPGTAGGSADDDLHGGMVPAWPAGLERGAGLLRAAVTPTAQVAGSESSGEGGLQLQIVVAGRASAPR